MGASLFDTTIEEMVYNSSEVQTWIHNGTEVFSAGKMISYYVDTDSVYYEKFKKGTDCLNPTTFVPKKTGWTFVGWREDTTATPDVLKSKVVGSEEITLYAVFEQTVTVNYSGNGNTGGSTAASTGKKHYNNGNTKSATITLRSNGFSKTYYGFSKWAMGSTSGTKYNAGASVELSSNTTFYAIWTQTSCTATASGEGDSYNDNSWHDVKFKSLSKTPNTDEFFVLSSDRKYITVKKACTAKVTLTVNNGGGGECRVVVNPLGYYSSGSYIDESVSESSQESKTITRNYAAGEKIYMQVSNPSGNASITSVVYGHTLTLKVG